MTLVMCRKHDFCCLGTNNGSSSEILIDLTGFDARTPSPQRPPPPPPPAQIPQSIPADLFMSPPVFNLHPPFTNSPPAQSGSHITVTDRPITCENPSGLSLLEEELLSLGKVDGDCRT